MPAAQRLVVVTGATRGCGRSMVDRFIEAGHTVIGCGRSPERIAELAGRHPAPHDFSVADVRRDESVRDWAARILRQFGPPDLLVNNAAVINETRPLWEVPAAEFDDLFNVNVSGIANVVRHFVPAMVARRSGVIVNFSSGWGRSTAPEVAPYCATKWAVEGLTLALAQELPAGMAAVPLNPGIINTEMLRSCFGAQAAAYPDPDTWSRRAVPFLLQLSAADNGVQHSVP